MSNSERISAVYMAEGRAAEMRDLIRVLRQREDNLKGTLFAGRPADLGMLVDWKRGRGIRSGMDMSKPKLRAAWLVEAVAAIKAAGMEVKGL